MPQVGVLAACMEFIGAVALGSRVTGTIKNGIINIDHYKLSPGVLMLVMGCAEIGSAFWLMWATKMGFPVSTTQTVVGALVGAGIASTASIKWGWSKGSVSQIAASWAISPLIAGAISAILFATLKYGILERPDPMKRAMRAIPWYFGFTAAVLALFMVVENPSGQELEDYPLGVPLGAILGTFAGVTIFSYIFMVPFFHRRLILEDTRVCIWHVPLGPLLYRENPPLYWPGSADDEIVKDYYRRDDVEEAKPAPPPVDDHLDLPSAHPEKEITVAKDPAADLNPAQDSTSSATATAAPPVTYLKPEPEERWLEPVKHLPIYNSRRLWNSFKYLMLQGVSRDCVSHQSEHIRKAHALAVRYDNRVEHLWTYAQVVSAMMMSIAHG